MSCISPAEQVRLHFDERDRAYEAQSAERKKAAAERLMADPLSLAFVIAEAIEEDPQTWGYALQALRDGEAFQIAALATAAVYESL